MSLGLLLNGRQALSHHLDRPNRMMGGTVGRLAGRQTGSSSGSNSCQHPLLDTDYQHWKRSLPASRRERCRSQNPRQAVRNDLLLLASSSHWGPPDDVSYRSTTTNQLQKIRNNPPQGSEVSGPQRPPYSSNHGEPRQFHHSPEQALNCPVEST